MLAGEKPKTVTRHPIMERGTVFQPLENLGQQEDIPR